MNQKHARMQRLALGLVITGMALAPLAAQAASCGADQTAIPVSGTILNHALQPGTTLGTAHIKLRGHPHMHCGILGQGGAGADGSVNFIHTLVCNDEVISPLSGASHHSQLTLNTSGVGSFQACPDGYPPGAAMGSFQETSVPVPGTGRGLFADVTRGEIHINGTLNCMFAINMEFSGALCMNGRH